MNYGSFSTLQVNYVSGSGIWCDTRRSGGTVWQQCCCGYSGSFEFMKNGGYVLTQSQWGTLPSGCSVSGYTITCSVSLSLSSGDSILATWYEPSRSTSLADNGGSIVVDAVPDVLSDALPDALPD